MKFLSLLRRLDGNQTVLIYEEDSQSVIYNGKLLDMGVDLLLSQYIVDRIGTMGTTESTIEIDVRAR